MGFYANTSVSDAPVRRHKSAYPINDKLRENQYTSNIDYGVFSVKDLAQDLSGSLVGAGGIGGLISVTRNTSSTTETFYPCCDANGNISDYVNSNGTVVAHREYDAYGNTIASSGAVSDFNFWFSSKYYDQEAGMYQFNRRYYNPSEGRWLNRDPMEEEGGGNLYEYCQNGPVSSVDLYGMLTVKYLSEVTAGYNTALAEDDEHIVYAISGTVSTADDHSTRAQKGTDETNAGQYHHYAYRNRGRARVCNTPSDMQIKAKTDCPGRYSIVCRFSYWATVRSYDEAVASVTLRVAGLRMRHDIDGGTGAYARSRAVLNIGYVRYTGTMDLTEEYRTIGQLFANLSFYPYGWFVEKGSITCHAFPE